MTRPRYETPAQLAQERAVALILARWLGRAGTKLPPDDHADYQFGPLFAEIKCRPATARRQYRDLLVSRIKYDAANQLRRPTILVAKWSDVVGVVSIHKPDYFAIGGRIDRGDPRDVEECAYYNVERFEVIA